MDNKNHSWMISDDIHSNTTSVQSEPEIDSPDPKISVDPESFDVFETSVREYRKNSTSGKTVYVEK